MKTTALSVSIVASLAEYDVGGYIWLDNPGLGAVPTTRKLVSQTYPY